jgi:hypothetical protein
MFGSYPLSTVSLSTKEKAQHGSGQTPTTLGFLDTFYFPWTVFIFPGRDLFLGDKHLSREINSCPSHNFPLIASLPYSRKAFQAFRNQLEQKTRKIKSVRPIGRN